MIRSALFVPADRQDRVAKARATAADLVIVDLEDAVAANAKTLARDLVGTLLASDRSDPRLAVRINALTTVAGIADLAALAETPPGTVLLPKTESARDIAILRAFWPATRIIALIESATGLRECSAIAMAGVHAIMLGGVDLAAELGLPPSQIALQTARGQLVLACAAAGIAAIDAPFIDIADPQGLLVEAQMAQAMGFAAKAAIHPGQVEPINNVWTPSSEEVDNARAALAAFSAAGESAVRHAGRMIDEPVARHLRRLLARVDGGKG
jgi:citrate lyase beta subunit